MNSRLSSERDEAWTTRSDLSRRHRTDAAAARPGQAAAGCRHGRDRCRAGDGGRHRGFPHHHGGRRQMAGDRAVGEAEDPDRPFGRRDPRRQGGRRNRHRAAFPGLRPHRGRARFPQSVPGQRPAGDAAHLQSAQPRGRWLLRAERCGPQQIRPEGHPADGGSFASPSTFPMPAPAPRWKPRKRQAGRWSSPMRMSAR